MTGTHTRRIAQPRSLFEMTPKETQSDRHNHLRQYDVRSRVGGKKKPETMWTVMIATLQPQTQNKM